MSVQPADSVDKPLNEIEEETKPVDWNSKDLDVPLKKVDGDKKSTFQKFKETVQKGSLVSVGFGGRSLKDDYFIWLLFTLAIVVLVAMKLVQDLTTVGQILSSQSYK